MNAMIKSAGYMIQDVQGIAIYGIGTTADEAWAQVVNGVGTFFDANGDDITAEEARETQFETYGASAALIAKVKADGGAGFAWRVVDGVACTVIEEENAIG